MLINNVNIFLIKDSKLGVVIYVYNPLRQVDPESEDSFSYRVRPCLKFQTKGSARGLGG